MVTAGVRVRHVEEAPYELECAKCGGAGDVLLRAKSGAVCLNCVGLGHLEFLPAGSAVLTRRAVKASRQPRVVMKLITVPRRSMRGPHHERQGILAEPAAIERAAHESLDEVDVQGRDVIAAAIREQLPGCPAERAEAIALHTAVRCGGRGRRRVGAKKVDTEVVRAAVEASVLHVDTEYDALVESGVDAEIARARVRERMESMLGAWRDGVAMLDA